MSQLKIISWNIWGGKNLPEIINCLKEADADIIALQEVLEDEDGKNNNAEEVAKTLGYNWKFTNTKTLSPSVSYLLQQHDIKSSKHWGNAVLSKHSIINSESHTLSENNSRTALKITIEFEKGNIDILSTHLVHAAHPSDVRVGQVENLLKLISNNNTIIAGDFNDTSESESITKIKERMKCGEDASHTNKDEKIDYIFTTKNINIIKSGVIKSEASDHLPIYAIIEI